MPDVRAMWRNRVFEAIFGSAYNFGIEHEWFARPMGRALFGTDVDRVYDSMATVATLPAGSRILDVPCGGGIAFRGLRPDQQVCYVAADISPAMLDRARRRARQQGLRNVTCVETDIVELPFGDRQFDLCMCFNGLHCLPNPSAALREIARCLKPGGRVMGDCVVNGQRRRADAYAAALRAVGIFGASASLEDLRAWLGSTELQTDRLMHSGAVAHFSAIRARADVEGNRTRGTAP